MKRRRRKLRVPREHHQRADRDGEVDVRNDAYPRAEGEVDACPIRRTRAGSGTRAARGAPSSGAAPRRPLGSAPIRASSAAHGRSILGRIGPGKSEEAVVSSVTSGGTRSHPRDPLEFRPVLGRRSLGFARPVHPQAHLPPFRGYSKGARGLAAP